MPQPVSLLLRQSLMLKDAVQECLKDPAPKPVHRLRSTTRRIEATLKLLTLSGSLPDLQQEAKPLAKLLRRVRRAAAKVRDLDVHLDLLKKYRGNRDGDEEEMSRLERSLTKARKKAARQLQKSLQKDQRRIPREFDRLEVALKPALDLAIGGAALADVALSWLLQAIRGLDPQEDDPLHSVRKACKTARYLAEIGAPNSKTAAGMASRFQRVQQTLGAWHDSLLLEEEALASLGEQAQIVEQIQADTLRLRQRAVDSTRHLPKTSRIAPNYLLH